MTAGGAAGQDAALRLLGKVRTAEEGSFELQERRGKFTVDTSSAAVEVHKAIPLKDARKGAKMHILGRHQEPQRDPNSSSTVPAQIVQVVTVVVSDSFTPPPLAKEYTDRKLEWISGEATVSEKEVKLGSTNVQAGRDRIVLSIEPGTMADIAKGKQVLVVGEKSDGSKKLTAKRVAVIAPQIPAAEYRPVLGL